MAVLVMATADLDDLSIFTSYNLLTRSTAVGARTGTWAYRTQYTSGVVLPIPVRATYYIKMAVYTGDSFHRVYFRAGSTNRSCLICGLGSIYIYESVTLRTTITNCYNPTGWDCLEIKYVPHDSAGEFTLKVNGVLVSTNTGLNLSSAADINNLFFDNTSNSTTYFDDLVIDDANWPGLGGLEVLRPSDNGQYTDWDAGGYADVADDSDATYIATDAEAAAKHSFALPALAADRKTPTAVGLFTKSQLSGAGAGTLRPFFRKSTTDTPGDSQALSTGLAWARNFQTQLPDEVGLEVVV